MSTGYSWEGIRQVRATLLCARHVPERLCGGRVYLGRYIKYSTFTFTFTFLECLCVGLHACFQHVSQHHMLQHHNTNIAIYMQELLWAVEISLAFNWKFWAKITAEMYKCESICFRLIIMPQFGHVWCTGSRETDRRGGKVGSDGETSQGLEWFMLLGCLTRAVLLCHTSWFASCRDPLQWYTVQQLSVLRQQITLLTTSQDNRGEQVSK